MPDCQDCGHVIAWKNDLCILRLGAALIRVCRGCRAANFVTDQTGGIYRKTDAPPMNLPSQSSRPGEGSP